MKRQLCNCTGSFCSWTLQQCHWSSYVKGKQRCFKSDSKTKPRVKTFPTYSYSKNCFISTERVCVCAKGSFLRRRHISTVEAYFYGGGVFLQRRFISTKKVYFYERGQFKSNRLITCMEKRNQCTAQMSFYVETAALFYNVKQWH